MDIDLFGNLIVEDNVVETKKVKPSPFSFVNNISDKKYPESLEGFSPYLINLAFSQRQDTVIFANEMNKYHGLSERSQFDFYFHGLPKKSYFSKWAKASKEENIDAVCAYYNCSGKEAKSYLKVLTQSQIQQIEEWFERYKGGTNDR